MTKACLLVTIAFYLFAITEGKSINKGVFNTRLPLGRLAKALKGKSTITYHDLITKNIPDCNGLNYLACEVY